MRLSRLRLRLAAAFAIAFVLGLGALTAGVLTYLWSQANRRLDTRLAAITTEVMTAIDREVEDAPDAAIAFAAREVAAEWPANEDSFGIFDERGVAIASVDRAHAIDSASAAGARAHNATRYTFGYREQDFHAVVASMPRALSKGKPAPLRIVAFASTEGIERDTELLGGVLAFAAPIIVLLSLGGGYMLARRALLPVSALRDEIGAIAPGDLSRRISVGAAHDEIGALATEFNALLARLDDAQKRNRGFVREAAHQIRTPLTLVLGEAAHALSSAPVTGDDNARAALARVRTAAEQMQRRVNELMLLAEAQAGEPVRLDDDVELDGLVLECTDLMRARATQLGRTLAIGVADHTVVRGNAMLLREALVELIENACRHGLSTAPITVSSRAGGGRTSISVESAGAPFARPDAAATNASRQGLGLPIVEWIARAHGGELRVARDGDKNVASVVFL